MAQMQFYILWYQETGEAGEVNEISELEGAANQRKSNRTGCFGVSVRDYQVFQVM